MNLDRYAKALNEELDDGLDGLFNDAPPPPTRMRPSTRAHRSIEQARRNSYAVARDMRVNASLLGRETIYDRYEID